MVNLLGAIGGGAIGGASVTIVIRAVDKYSKVLGAANVSLAKLGVAMTAVGIAGAFAVGGLLKVAGQFEQTQIAFSTMLGSAEEAQVLLKELADFAARTPFQIPDVEKNAKLLLAMGIEVDKLLPTMKALGDVSAGLSVPLERIALNFGQVKTQAKLTGRELRDFNIAGVPLIQEIAKNMGLTEKAVKEMVSAGKIGFDEVEKAFITMSSEGGKFFDLMDAQSKTFLGQVSNIQDSLISVARVMGAVFLPAAKLVAEHLATIVGWFQEHPTVAKFAAITLGVGTALALIIGPLLIITAMMPLIIAQWGTLAAVTLPITGIILGISLAIAGIIIVFKKWQDNQEAFLVGFATFWNGVVDVVELSINAVIKAINRLITSNIFIKGAKLLGLGDFEIQEVSLKRTDIGALIDKINANKEVTEEIGKQNNELTKQEQLVKQLEGFRLIASTGDIFNPKGFSLSKDGDLRGEFKTRDAADLARAGFGVIINIENINGLDPEEISRALSEELNKKLSI